MGAIFLFVSQTSSHATGPTCASCIYIFSIYIYTYIYICIYKARMLDRVACEPRYKNPKISPQMFRTKIVHTSGICFDFLGVDVFDFLGSKNIFNLCSHIELNTQNPNPTFKIATCFTKTPKLPKHFRFFVARKSLKDSKHPNIYFVICIKCLIHILYCL